MTGIIAIEKVLSNLTEPLETEGYDVVPLEDNVEEVDAIIVSGADINIMNMQDVVSGVPVINAVGKSVEDIIDELKNL